jgi:hypothetical protein
MLTLPTQRCPKEIMKIFLIEDFFHFFHRCQRYRWCTLTSKYPREFSKKIQNGPNGIIRGLGGKLIHVENLKYKISWHYPFKCVNDSVSRR